MAKLRVATLLLAAAAAASALQSAAGARAHPGARGVRARARPCTRSRSSAFASASGGARAVWEEAAGCHVVRPAGTPRAVVHFLGGVFASPSPQVLYRAFLERLAARGYLVVATPYASRFDYLQVADEVLSAYEAALPAALAPYGEAGAGLAQLGVGHSLGALMLTIIGSLFADSAPPYAGAALLAHNNKQLSDAVPGFEALVAPALAPYASLAGLPSYRPFLEAASSLRTSTLALARDAAAASPGGRAWGGLLDDVAALGALADQLPPLFEEIAQGVTEFTPAPAELREALVASYALPSTLVLSFSDDSIDESDKVAAALEARGAAALERLSLRGTHVTPLTPDPAALPLQLAEGAAVPAGLSPTQLAKLLDGVQSATLADLERLVDAVDEWGGRALERRAAAAAAPPDAAPTPAAPSAVPTEPPPASA